MVETNISNLRNLANDYYTNMIIEGIKKLGYEYLEKAFDSLSSKRKWKLITKDEKAACIVITGGFINLYIISIKGQGKDIILETYNEKTIYDLMELDKRFQRLSQEDYEKDMTKSYIRITNEDLDYMGLFD